MLECNLFQILSVIASQFKPSGCLPGIEAARNRAAVVEMALQDTLGKKVTLGTQNACFVAAISRNRLHNGIP